MCGRSYSDMRQTYLLLSNLRKMSIFSHLAAEPWSWSSSRQDFIYPRMRYFLGIDEGFPPSNSKEKMSLPSKSWLLRGMLCVFLIHVLLKCKTVALFYLRRTLMLFIICEPKQLLKSPHLIHDHILLGYIKGVPLRIKTFCVKNRA